MSMIELSFSRAWRVLECDPYMKVWNCIAIATSQYNAEVIIGSLTAKFPKTQFKFEEVPK